MSQNMHSSKKSELECTICCGRFQHPKILGCLHSFCSDCLKKHKASNSPQSVSVSGSPQQLARISCPICERHTEIPGGVDGLKTNAYLVGLLDEITMQEQVSRCGETKLTCGSCEDVKSLAVSRCLDCALYLCSSCERVHTRFAALSTHKIATLDEIKYGVVEISKVRQEVAPKCRRHYGEVLTLLCETCQEPICHDCTLVDHSESKNHKHVDISTAFAERKQSLGELFPALHYSVLVMEQSVENALEMKSKLGSSSGQTMRDIRRRAAEMKAMVTTEENKMIEDVQRIREDRDAKFEEFARKVQEKKEQIEHSLTTARNLFNTASKTDFLNLYSTMSRELKVLGTQRPPKIDSKLSFLTFEASDDEDGRINLGNLVMEGKWEMYRQFGQEGTGEGDFSCARGIAAMASGDIAVADQWNKRVVICSTDGTLKATIPTEDYPFDVATFNNQILVIDSTRSVKVYNTNRTLVFEFQTVPAAEEGKTRVNLASIAVKKDGTIVVGDIHRMVLTEHRPADGSLLRTVPIRTPPHYLGIDDTSNRNSTSGRVFISGADKRVLEAVDATSGDTLFTVKPLVDNDRVDYCTGVCSDSSGIYLAVHGGSDTGHIHHYDTQGKFRGCVAQGLHYPMNLKICTGRQQLAVADWTSIKIFQLEHV